MASNIVEMTKELAQDFIYFKVGKANPVTSISLSARTLKRVATEVEAKHGDLFESMTRRISCSDDNISESFKKIVENMFADNVINWGRIAVLFTFAGHIALYCDRHGSQEDPDLVVLLLTEFVNRKLLKWIQNNGGWDSFNEHFKERKDDTGVWWRDALCVGLVAGAALVFAR
ncbi:bcl-2 1 [Paramuricea clavata]|uniref:Bcl-2 1 n=1 Tax=Paramuricea clavata TaxID=317549 RepID=A0A6S7G6P7_PARCT|nr:bcl-2 1 [Paramuricea clavata]